MNLTSCKINIRAPDFLLLILFIVHKAQSDIIKSNNHRFRRQGGGGGFFSKYSTRLDDNFQVFNLAVPKNDPNNSCIRLEASFIFNVAYPARSFVIIFYLENHLKIENLLKLAFDRFDY
jgi:hypothetical protein